MTKDDFWNLIDEARASGAECDAIVDAVADRLRVMPPTEVLAFTRHLDECRAESYRNDLWAIAYIVNGGCSEDGFEYFRCWLITQGRTYYEAALLNPERAADHADPGSDEHECEDILYVSGRIYEELTGEELPDTGVDFPADGPLGEEWKEEDLERLYPKLCERFFA